MKKQGGHSGGRSWSLGASAKMKSNSTHYNPAEIKKQREFYKNAKHIKKYKKLKQKTDHEYSQMRIEPIDLVQEEINSTSRKKQRKKSNLQTLREEYEKKKQEEEKAKMEAEAIQEAKKKEKEKVMAQKKELKHKMLKRTRSGQPIMKYRLDHLIETLQRGSN
ncbi:ATP-dependent RNA helicase dbp3 [Nymphaea colorata]|nr:ATP-dependent RNA helicase dbp3 [Nymphaea colorata]XP_031484686.1 ATP-dependent RNA helicase dbp3 [Nymphaea colorata]